MYEKIGASSQIIHFNYIHNFISENLNKILYNIFTPGVINCDAYSEEVYENGIYIGDKIVITELSCLIQPKNKEFILKVDIINPIEIIILSEKIEETILNKPFLTLNINWEDIAIDNINFEEKNPLIFEFKNENEITNYDIIILKIIENVEPL